MNIEQKTAFIAIVGRANVGKSSIMNRLLGQKTAIVSPKPQTTRTKIMGVLTEVDTQLVFTDTPGFHRPKTKLGEKMVKAVGDSISGVDACLLVTEPAGEPQQAELELMERFRREEMPAVLAINKIDTLPAKSSVIERMELFSALFAFGAIVPVSALKGEGMDALFSQLQKFAVPSVHFFPEDSLTDQPERILAAEIIREKLLLLLDQEIPHEIAVVTETMREREDGLLEIEALIYCGKESHKGIIIGKRGAKLKEVSIRARRDLERFFQCPVHLRCFVKVKEGWRNRENLLREFGLD